MDHVIPHDLDAATARRVAEKAFASYAARFASYDPKLEWSDDRHAKIGMTALGTRLKGTMALDDKAIRVDLDVPFLMRPFRAKAIEVVDREVKTWIEKAHTGEV